MMASVRDWYRALSRREQVLVAGAAGLALALLLVWLTVLLYRAHEQAETDYNLTVANAARVSAQLDRIERSGQIQTADFAQSMHLVVAASAAEQGFTLNRNEPSGNSQTSIMVASARPSALFGWFNTLEAQGILVESVTIQPTQGGNVSADAQLRKAGN